MNISYNCIYKNTSGTLGCWGKQCRLTFSCPSPPNSNNYLGKISTNNRKKIVNVGKKT